MWSSQAFRDGCSLLGVSSDSAASVPVAFGRRHSTIDGAHHRVRAGSSPHYRHYYNRLQPIPDITTTPASPAAAAGLDGGNQAGQGAGSSSYHQPIGSHHRGRSNPTLLTAFVSNSRFLTVGGSLGLSVSD